MKIERMTEIELSDIQIGDRLHVGGYTATCQKVTDDGAVFLLDQYLDRAMAMNRQNTNKGGYDGSELRRALQSEDILKEFEDIREYMRPWSNGDLLRVPFAGEMFGDDVPQWIEPDDCEQWPLMKDAHNRAASRCGEPEWGWLANTVRDSSTYFCNVDNDGNANAWSASNVLGVRPVFQIAADGGEMSRLDDEEQLEYIQRWTTNRRKMEAEIKMIRGAYAEGAISLIRMEVMIWQAKRKYRRAMK